MDQQKKIRTLLLSLVKETLREIKPERLFKPSFSDETLKDFERIIVISIGKAAAGMAKALIKNMKRHPDAVLMADEGHPLPTPEGMRKTDAIITAAGTLTKKDCAIVLISGGGSAMLVKPAPGLTLAQKIAVTKTLLKSGASIQEMNVVRKHLSAVKGGRLAQLLYPATVWGFVLSDVIGDDLGTIASGPLSPDQSTYRDALNIVKKYRTRLPKTAMRYLQKGAQKSRDRRRETPKRGAACFKNVYITIIANHATPAQKAFEEAKRHGIRTIILKERIAGEARKSVKNFIKKGRSGVLLIGSGETTVTCKGTGYGGRNQEFVLAGLPYLKKNQTLISIGTDGIDGFCPEKIAGAIGDNKIIKTAQKKKLQPAEFLNKNDSYTFFKKTGGLIKTGPTGTNLGDLMLLYTEAQ